MSLGEFITKTKVEYELDDKGNPTDFVFRRSPALLDSIPAGVAVVITDSLSFTDDEIKADSLSIYLVETDDDTIELINQSKEVIALWTNSKQEKPDLKEADDLVKALESFGVNLTDLSSKIGVDEKDLALSISDLSKGDFAESLKDYVKESSLGAIDNAST